MVIQLPETLGMPGMWQLYNPKESVSGGILMSGVGLDLFKFLALISFLPNSSFTTPLPHSRQPTGVVFGSTHTLHLESQSTVTTIDATGTVQSG